MFPSGPMAEGTKMANQRLPSTPPRPHILSPSPASTSSSVSGQEANTASMAGNSSQQHLAGYKYNNMSNLVLQADRRFTHRTRDEATGDPESLAGRINVREMGARVVRDKADLGSAKRQKPAIERGDIRAGEDVLERERRKRKRDGASAPTFSLADLDIEDLRYRPRTQATRDVYNLMVTAIGRKLGDVPAQVTISAADATLEELKDTDKKDLDKKLAINDLLGINMSTKDFTDLVNLGKKLTDYGAEDVAEDADNVVRGEGKENEDRQGVAVVFHEGDDDDEQDRGQTFEINDESSSDEDEEEDSKDQEDPNTDSRDLIIGDVSRQDAGPRSQDKHVVPIHEIDAFWLQRQLGQAFEDAHTRQEKTSEAMEILSRRSDDGQRTSLRDVENDLMELFDFEHSDLVTKLVLNRDRIVWVTQWRRAAENSADRRAVENAMADDGHKAILHALITHTEPSSAAKKQAADRMDVDASTDAVTDKPDVTMHDVHQKRRLQPGRVINLENLVFEQGNHLMTNPNVKLPPGSIQKKFKGYEEIHVPAPKPHKNAGDTKNMATSDLPAWARPGFGSSKSLNRIQTDCYPTAFEDDGNMLVCAPTGSGKTNVAMLAMLREIGKHRDPETGEINLDEFKIVYIAPLKALVQEQTGNFGARLAPYGIKVSELTGDRQLTKQQITETQVIVTTPEKWDVITRKATDLSYINLVRLICIDEIHLLHDDRGPVLESIVSRTIRRTEQTGDPVRILGLSATLPNYRDVATFLRVDPQKGMFHFDGSFRPCPLQQEFIGITEKKPIKQIRTMNEVCYTKVLEQVGQKRNQMLIFTHSRKDTAKTAKYIRDKALENETIGQILRSDAASREILTSEAESVTNDELKDIMPYGFGIHHAGMNRADRTSVEELFADGSIQVLVCTATLAWGVNLPAHTVIIKGTTIYSPERGSWVELSPQDVLQMLGRAGRPQYDTFGEGIIITKHSEMQYYMSLMNQQLPIESQLISRLSDALNAEVVLNNIRTREEGVDWLSYTYLFVRMIRSPGLYSVGADYEDDDALEQKRTDLIHSAAVVLQKCGLIRYEHKSGKFQSTALGRIASHYYIGHNSMQTYNSMLLPDLDKIEMFRVFSHSDEFKNIPVRQDEKLALAQLLQRVPIPVKEGVDEPAAKINVLLQAYVSRMGFEGLALMTDLVYVTQSAGRLMRAIFEICLERNFAESARLALDLCKMADRRMWPVMSPLRQFPERSDPGVPTISKDIIAKAERVGVQWKQYYDLDPPRLGELLGMPKAGRAVEYAVKHFPRLDVQAQVQPLTRSLLQIELTIKPIFEWNTTLHGAAELFWIIIEDNNSEYILFHDQFLLKKEYAQAEMNEHIVEATVTLSDPMPPVYFVTVVSDRWMAAQTRISLSLRNMKLPEKFAPPTQLLDLQPLPVSALKRDDYQELYRSWGRFNKIQTQVFNSLFTTNNNVLVAAPVSSGKTVCAEFALLHHWLEPDAGKAVYIAPLQELVDLQFTYWKERLSHIGGGKSIVKLTGETSADLRLLAEGDLILATPAQWDVISRSWQRRKNVQSVTLVVADDLHMIGGLNGHTYESAVSRMHAMALQLESGMRIVGLSVSLASARDMGEWLGATKHNIFNFSPHNRPVPLELHVQSFTNPHFPSLMMAMARPAYQAIVEMSSSKPAMLFVPGRKQVRKTAVDLFGVCVSQDDEERFLHTSVEEMKPVLDRINEKALAESLTHGLGYYHEALSAFDKQAVKYLFQQGAIQVMIVSRDCAFEIDEHAHLVIIMGTQYFEGREHRYYDYPVSEVLQMFGRAGRPNLDKTGKGVLMVPGNKREYYKKFLNEALPVESQLQGYIAEVFVPEISAKIISATQDAVDWTTYTYFYRRLLANPSFYGLSDTSHEGMSAYLSDLVENTLKELDEAKMIEYDEDEDSVSPLNPAMIAAYYNISYVTTQTYLMSLTARTKMRAMLEIVTAASEFETIQMRRREDVVLRRVYDRLPIKMTSEPMYESPQFKAFVLVQAHFSRLQLPIDLLEDQRVILRRVLPLLSSCVDILSSEGHLNATVAMELSQMVVQGMWDRESPLLQMPHFGPEQVDAAEGFGVTSIEQFMTSMDPEENTDYEKMVQKLGFSNRQLQDIAEFTNNKYPEVEMSFEIVDPDDITAGSPSTMQVKMERNVDEDVEVDTTVHAPFYPAPKTENWWVVIGEKTSNELLAIKRVTFGAEVSTKLDFVVPKEGKHELTLYLMSDSYLDVDEQHDFHVDVKPGEEDEEVESESGEE